MKLCIDCKNYNTENSTCGIGWSNPINSAKTKIYAANARLSEVYCGVNAIKFELKEPPKPKLRPCWLCGSEPYIEQEDDELMPYIVICEKCKICVSANDEVKAIEMWNRSVK